MMNRRPQGASAKPGMIVHQAQPLNAEPQSAQLRAAFMTPQEEFYIRCHGNVPRIAKDGYKLKTGGQGATTLELTLDDLRTRFPQRTVTAVMQCAGNRRADMLQVKYVSGDAWGPGAISNAEWTGVGLADVLKAAGIKDDPKLYVAFACHDEIEEEGEHFNFGVSIPLSKAMAPETIIALSMNGEPLTAEHGFPLRVVTPGYAGVRSPKWLASITVQDRPSDNRIQQKAYKLFPPDVSKETADFSKGLTIDDMPLNSAICEPAANATLPAGPTTVRGYAIATGRRIIRVDVSANGGKSWRQADLERHIEAPWSWTFWNAELDLPKGEQELVVRAWDGAGETQPSSTADVWNYPGYLSAAWHRVKVKVS
jgi:sulfite oxidase